MAENRTGATPVVVDAAKARGAAPATREASAATQAAEPKNSSASAPQQRTTPLLGTQTEIDEKIRIEAEFLSLEAAREIAAHIAKVVAGEAQKLTAPVRVVLGDEALFAAVQIRPRITAQIELLKAQLERLLSD